MSARQRAYAASGGFSAIGGGAEPPLTSKNPAEGGGSGGRSPSGLLVAGTSHSTSGAPAGSKGLDRRVQKLRDRERGTAVVRPRWIDLCEHGEAHLELVRRDGTEAAYARAKCHSWRHAGECRRWRTQQDFARVRDALEGVPLRCLTMIVLTLDQATWKENGLTPADAYRKLVRLWQTFNQYLTRAMGGSWPYVVSIEAHAPQRGGWPHMNAVLTNPLIADFLRQYPAGARRWLKDNAAHFGFGWRSSIERVYDKDGCASYVTKHENVPTHGGAVGEVVKLSQLPLNAPSGFRRLRASKGFLPKRFTSSGEWTGRYVAAALPEVQLQRQEGATADLARHLGIRVQPGESPADAIRRVTPKVKQPGR